MKDGDMMISTNFIFRGQKVKMEHWKQKSIFFLPVFFISNSVL